MLLVALAISGCGTGAPRPVPTALATPSAGAADLAQPSDSDELAAEVPEEDTQPSLGDRVSKQSEAVAAYQAGSGYYDWKDGTYTIVDPHTPLPDDVLADIEALYGFRGGVPTWTNPAEDTAWDVKARAGSLRKELVYIVMGGAFDTDHSLISYGWHSANADSAFMPPSDSNGVAQWWATKDQAVTHAQQVIASKPDPSIYQIIDLTD